MPIKKVTFKPNFVITPSIATLLIRIEAIKHIVENLPITHATLSHLKEEARLASTHYSTKIEGNRLNQEEVKEVIASSGKFPGRERDAHEYYANNLMDYYKALDVGPSHNYYFGRAEVDITNWIEYFCTGIEQVFEQVKEEAQAAAKRGKKDQSPIFKTLD